MAGTNSTINIDAGGVDSMNPLQTNPLIEYGNNSDETIYNVQAALDFIADSLTEIERGCGFSKETAHGVNVLIRCCMAALDSAKSAQSLTNKEG